MKVFDLIITFCDGKQETTLWNEKAVEKVLERVKNNGYMVLEHEIIERNANKKELAIMERHKKLNNDLDKL